MRRFEWLRQVQCFLSVHGPINNLFRGGHLMKATPYRLFRDKAFTTWRGVTTGLAPIYGEFHLVSHFVSFMRCLDNLTEP